MNNFYRAGSLADSAISTFFIVDFCVEILIDDPCAEILNPDSFVLAFFLADFAADTAVGASEFSSFSVGGGGT